MVALRAFSASDAGVIQEKLMPGASLPEVFRTIEAWDSHVHQGRHFEMYALTADGMVVGNVSLYAHTNSVASVGAEVFPEARGRGFGAEGMRRIIEIARARGYRVIQDQVRADNAASIALHEKLGFETDGYIYKNERGREVLLYLLCL